MSTAITTRASSNTPWSSRSTPLSNISSTPCGLPSLPPGQGSVGLVMSQGHSARSRSPRSSRDPRTPGPSYFDIVVDPGSNNPTDSDAGRHAKRNWNSAGYRQLVGTPPDSRPNFEAFRKQSQTTNFSLSHGSLSHFSLGSPAGQSQPTEPGEMTREGAVHPKSRSLSISKAGGKATPSIDRMEIDSTTHIRPPSMEYLTRNATTSFFDIPKVHSPPQIQSPAVTSTLSLSQAHNFPHLDERYRPNSLPHNVAGPPSPATGSHSQQRADTLPSFLCSDKPTMVSPQELADIMKTNLSDEILLLDLRVFPQFSQSRIKGAINLCIPTTLLKRPSFDVQKLAETFTKEQEKAKFNNWRQAKVIVVYDTSSVQLKDATSSVNTLKKFTNESWQGLTLIIRGGFAGFAKKYPDMVDKRLASEIEGSSTRKLAIDPGMSVAAPVAGGCVMPTLKTAANPFFGNIRQNMDLIGGVGQIEVKFPLGFGLGGMAFLPTWLRRISDERDKGKTVADQFLGIEKAEQLRMQKALSGNVSYGVPNPSSAEIQIAGIEKGDKNRYKDMLPYDHSRVRLQNVPSGGCDYVNASHIKSKWSHRQYIATQAPVPATFQDFWRVAWEQDARVIVMLTAETEGGQRKCHPYWLQGEYGPFKLKSLSERKVSLELPKRASSIGLGSSDQSLGNKRPGMEKRRSTNHGSPSQKETPGSPPIPSSPDSEIPHVIVRKLALSHAAYPFEPMREITQLQYSSWPDFGTPAHPAHVLGLVEYCGAVVKSYEPIKGRLRGGAPARKGERPIVVHCSAGCGRTGTFCTVDSVVDMMKRQRLQRPSSSAGDGGVVEPTTAMDIDSEGDEVEYDQGNDWIPSNDVDLVAETVGDLRLQRLSMVQTLRQFVLCYEAVLEWVVRESPERIPMGPAGARRSFHG